MDPGLVVRAQHGDEGAFAELVKTSIGHLNAVARLVMRDRDSAEDAVQEALVEAWRALPRLREPERIDAWLRRLLLRACFDRARRDRRGREVPMPNVGLDGLVGTDDDEAAMVSRDRLERGMRSLSTEHRAVLVLTYYLDLPLAESAAALGIPIGTMKSRLDRARSSLRGTLEAQDRMVTAPKEQLA